MKGSQTNNPDFPNWKLILAGVGGQGVLFVTRLLSEAAQELGMDFISSEIHGMSQRGGSVVSHFKIGPYESPLVRQGSADLLLAFTLDEGYRNLRFLRPGGSWVVNCPDPELLDDGIRTYLGKQGVSIHALDADDLVQKQPRVANVALIGYAAGCGALRLPSESLRAILTAISPAPFGGPNLEALQRGIEAGEAKQA
jgi:indolepyruvate ferredoxin oxidoreductase beta subunit